MNRQIAQAVDSLVHWRRRWYTVVTDADKLQALADDARKDVMTTELKVREAQAALWNAIAEEVKEHGRSEA